MEKITITNPLKENKIDRAIFDLDLAPRFQFPPYVSVRNPRLNELFIFIYYQ